LSKIISLFVACLSAFILIRRGFEENGSRQEKKQMAGSLVPDPLAKGRDKVTIKPDICVCAHIGV
jgi:hypothetical protein